MRISVGTFGSEVIDFTINDPSNCAFVLSGRKKTAKFETKVVVVMALETLTYIV